MKIKINDGGFQRKIHKLENVPKEVVKEAYRFFKATTPIRTGNARRKTSVRSTTISAKYPYAQRLDTGWSRQAPRGMTKPTLEFIKQEMKIQLKRIRRGTR